MPIDFDEARWERVRENYARWWAGELERPLIQITLSGRDPHRPPPARPCRPLTACYGEDVPAEQIVDCWDYELSCQEYLGDAFPHVWPNFGPGVAAVFMGGCAETAPEEGTVWFFPPGEVDVRTLHFTYQPDHPWLRRIKDICRAAIDRWEGLVQVAMTDLGGNLDLLSTFRPGQELLLDLYDHPEHVERLIWEAHEVWWRAFEDINSVLRPVNPGHTAWTPIFSAGPYYMLQCDFSYMIGPQMFDRFVRPELVASCRRLVNPFYHLDGPGALPHLDSLLSIEELKGIQWVPGAGQPDVTCWPEVYRRIRRAGKLIQTWGDMETLDALVQQLGSAEGIIILWGGDMADRPRAVEFLRKYGAL